MQEHCPPPPNYNVVFSLCYSWHMFCFMMTVGFVAAKYGHIENSQQKLVLRAKRLLLPYFVWTIIRAISLGHHTAVQILRDLFVAPIYWFLIVQFIYECIVYLCGARKNRKVLIVLFYLAIGLIYALTKAELLRQTVQYFPYYFLGYIAGIEERGIKQYKSILRRAILIAAILYPPSMYFYAFKDKTVVLTRLRNILVNMDVSNITVERISSCAYHGGFQIYNYLVVAMLGSAFYFCIAWIINSHGKFLCRIFSELGKETLQYYVISGFFYVTTFNKNWNWLLSLMFCFVMPHICAALIKRVSWLNKVLFGT